MKNYRNILCVTDFSENGKTAAARAAHMAKCFDARLTLLHVVEHFPEDRSNTEIAPEDVDPTEYQKQQARASLAELAQSLDVKPATQEVLFTTHSTKHEIVSYAEQLKPDLIVTATHGVLHGITCDTLTVHATT